MEVDYIALTPQGKQTIINDGYRYLKWNSSAGTTVYWIFDRKDKLSCKKRLKTNNTTIKATTGVHNHAPDATTTVSSEIATQSASTQESTHTIVQATVGAASIEAYAQLPTVHSLKRTARENVCKNVPPNP